MRRFIHKLFNALRPNDKARPAMRHSTRNFRPAVELLEERALLSSASLAPVNSYVQTNLVSNVQGMALKFDPNLVNPWDVNAPQDTNSDPAYYVADQGSGMATAYQISPNGSRVIVESLLAVTIPTVGSSEPSGPTGLAYNTHGGEFLIDGNVTPSYIFDTLQGTIGGYVSPNGIIATPPAEIMVNNSSTANPNCTAEYTGLAAGSYNGQNFIYAANEGKMPGIQVFNSSFVQVTKFGTKDDPVINPFIDPCLPAGFVPYGVRDLALGTTNQHDLFVTYRGPNFQGGAIAVFTNDGQFLGQIASDTAVSAAVGVLQSPWGLAVINHKFGEFSANDLFVGNFSSGQIDAYKVHVVNPNPNGTGGEASAVLVGQLLNANGTAFTIPGLRSIHFAPGLGSGKTHVGLFFTAETSIPLTNAGGNGNLSLYGEITPGPVTPRVGPVIPPGQPYVLGNGSGVPLVETAGSNLIIGGADGGAMLDSGSGQDIVSAGSTIFDNNAVALQAIESYLPTNSGTNLPSVAFLSTLVPWSYELNVFTATLHNGADDTIDLGSEYDWLSGVSV